MINKLIFLYSFNGGEIEAPFSPEPVAFSPAVEFLIQDSYVHMLGLLQKAGYVGKVYIISKCREESHRFAGYGIFNISKGMDIIYSPNLSSAEAYIGDIAEDDVIWTRGTADIWTQFLQRHNARNVLYNLAFLCADPSIYDLIFRDEDCKERKLLDHSHSYGFVKTCDEGVFYPLDMEKRYDIISVGTICERKGQLQVVRSALKLKRPLRIIFPGPIRVRAYMEKCIAQAAGSLVTLEFPGVVSRKELNVFLNQSDLHVLASRNEQAPRVLIEAASAGVPSLITTGLGGGQNYVTPETGWITSRWRLTSALRSALDTFNQKKARNGYLENFSNKHALDMVSKAFTAMGWI